MGKKLCDKKGQKKKNSEKEKLYKCKKCNLNSNKERKLCKPERVL